MDGSDALVNTNYENYCLARADGLTQRQAMLKAYPKRAKWKSSAIDSAAARLEADRRIKARIIYLKSAIAKLAILSRAEVLAGMSEAFSESLKTMKQDGIGPDSLAGVARIGKTLIDAIPDDVPTAAVQFVADFGLLIAEPFLSMHRRVAQDKGGNFWLYGGRASTKSSSISLEIVDGLMRHRERSAFAMVKRKTDIRDGVYEQFQWALAKLGVSEQWTCTVSPLRMIRKETGQVIAFRGGDNAEKTKSIKAPAGTYFAYTWIEEADQFSGMSELRTIYQSVTRDAGGDAVYFRFHSFNPPRSKKSWANKQIADLIAAGETVYKANYCDVPREWLPAQVYEDAERLKQVDHEAYLHEYMGEPVGFPVRSLAALRYAPSQTQSARAWTTTTTELTGAFRKTPLPGSRLPTTQRPVSSLSWMRL